MQAQDNLLQAKVPQAFYANKHHGLEVKYNIGNKVMLLLFTGAMNIKESVKILLGSYGRHIVFEGLVLRLEKDPDQTRPRPIKTGQDHNHGPVFSPSPFSKYQDWAKTGLSGLNQSSSLSTNTFHRNKYVLST